MKVMTKVGFPEEKLWLLAAAEIVRRSASWPAWLVADRHRRSNRSGSLLRRRGRSHVRV